MDKLFFDKKIQQFLTVFLEFWMKFYPIVLIKLLIKLFDLII